eukprot:COSAG01_NODE_15052_length_1379_cov_2.792969_2_plen_194_part_00
MNYITVAACRATAHFNTACTPAAAQSCASLPAAVITATQSAGSQRRNETLIPEPGALRGCRGSTQALLDGCAMLCARGRAGSYATTKPTATCHQHGRQAAHHAPAALRLLQPPSGDTTLGIRRTIVRKVQQHYRCIVRRRLCCCPPARMLRGPHPGSADAEAAAAAPRRSLLPLPLHRRRHLHHHCLRMPDGA